MLNQAIKEIFPRVFPILPAASTTLLKDSNTLSAWNLAKTRTGLVFAVYNPGTCVIRDSKMTFLLAAATMGAKPY